MNLKERGITVGDLLIILIIILTSTIVIKAFNKDKKTTLKYSNEVILTYNKPLLLRVFLFSFFLKYCKIING